MFVSFNTEHTSKYNGSPVAPISFVRSKTATFSTVFGKTFNRYFGENGRYK